MYELYYEEGMYNNLTKEQEEAFSKWRKYHKK